MFANYLISHARAATSRALGAVKAVVVNLESLVGETSTDAPVFGALGVISRPRAPVAHDDASGLAPEGEAEYLCVKYEDELQPIAARDLRISARTNPAEGEVMLAGYDGGFVSIKQAGNGQGSQVVILAPALNGSGVITTSHVLSMDPGAQNAVALLHRSGHGLLCTAGGDAILKNASGNTYVQCAGSAMTLNGNVQVVGGLVVAPGSPTPQPVLLATDALTYFAQNTAYLATLASAITALGGSVGGSPPTAIPIASTKLAAAP